MSVIREALLTLFSKPSFELLSRKTITTLVLSLLVKQKKLREPGSVIPSDFCYNQVNVGCNPWYGYQLFKMMGNGQYRVLGRHHRYTGPLLWKEKSSGKTYKVGKWQDGKLSVNKKVAKRLNREHKIIDFSNPDIGIIARGKSVSQRAIPDNLENDLRALYYSEAIAKYPEGATVRVTVNAYERNHQARSLCLEEFGYTCRICGFDFYKVYGEAGRDFIHVHHLIPLSQVGKGYEVDPFTDLLPVCPNCHALIHRENPPYTVEELCNMLGNKRHL